MNKAEVKINEDKLEVVISRVFDAPRERVWQAQTNPDLVSRWWGPKDYEMIVEKLEARVGGKWRILHVDLQGKEHWFNGEYKELIELEKIVRTFVYEPYPSDIMEESVLVEEVEGNKTKLTTVSRFPSLDALKGMVGSGMEQGATESLERLAELVENPVK